MIPLWMIGAGGTLVAAIACFGVYERGERRVVEVQAAFDGYKGEQAKLALAQVTAIARESAEQSREHLENVRGIVASAEIGKAELQHVIIEKNCERDALSDATAGSILRIRQRSAAPGPAAGGLQPPGGAKPAGAAAGR